MRLLFSMMLVFFVAATFAGGKAFAQTEAAPRVGEERIVLRTNMGDMVLALYPEVAPEHTAQILKLARLGVYDDIEFFRIEPSFVVQLADARAKGAALTEEQAAALRPLKPEFSPFKHRRGTLSMARYLDRPDSAESSFSILLGDAPHLDDQYTIFGHLERGEDVLDAISRVECDAQHRPIEPVMLEKVEVVGSQAALDRMSLRGALERRRAPQQFWAAAVFSTAYLWLVGGVVALGLALFLMSRRYIPAIYGSFGLLLLLAGFFILFVALLPRANTSQLLAVTLFLGIISLFKLMNRFESRR